MAGDYRLLVGRDDPDVDAAVPCADAGGASRIRAGVQPQPEPSQARAYSGADGRGVLADSGGEHQAVQPAQRADQGAHFRGDPVGEQLDGFTRPEVIVRQQVADVAAGPGDLSSPER